MPTDPSRPVGYNPGQGHLGGRTGRRKAGAIAVVACKGAESREALVVLCSRVPEDIPGLGQRWLFSESCADASPRRTIPVAAREPAQRFNLVHPGFVDAYQMADVGRLVRNGAGAQCTHYVGVVVHETIPTLAVRRDRLTSHIQHQVPLRDSDMNSSDHGRSTAFPSVHAGAVAFWTPKCQPIDG